MILKPEHPEGRASLWPRVLWWSWRTCPQRHKKSTLCAATMEEHPERKITQTHTNCTSPSLCQISHISHSRSVWPGQQISWHSSADALRLMHDHKLDSCRYICEMGDKTATWWHYFFCDYVSCDVFSSIKELICQMRAVEQSSKSSPLYVHSPYCIF